MNKPKDDDVSSGEVLRIPLNQNILTVLEQDKNKYFSEFLGSLTKNSINKPTFREVMNWESLNILTLPPSYGLCEMTKLAELLKSLSGRELSSLDETELRELAWLTRVGMRSGLAVVIKQVHQSAEFNERMKNAKTIDELVSAYRKGTGEIDIIRFGIEDMGASKVSLINYLVSP